jgi:hypothetical protein
MLLPPLQLGITVIASLCITAAHCSQSTKFSNGRGIYVIFLTCSLFVFAFVFPFTSSFIILNDVCQYFTLLRSRYELPVPCSSFHYTELPHCRSKVCNWPISINSYSGKPRFEFRPKNLLFCLGWNIKNVPGVLPSYVLLNSPPPQHTHFPSHLTLNLCS